MKTFPGFIKTTFMAMTVIAAIIFINGCKKTTDKPATTTPASNEVTIQNTAFGPTTLTVAVNTTVKWTNKDGFAHTVTSTTGLFDSGTIGGGGTYSHQFTSAGTFPYKCNFHSNMTGTVVVQ